ncbi:hypothetical protein [Oceanobacter mangrovi]|uniref:hypothetical protein n=1 Tax=Oceanobacter mangrovi TaxID=2862510 RepID=UPI001C8F0F69|nr:hypothetical protein [Oceanobacter mangrovi]
MNGKWDSEAKGSWTAISRTPWLKSVSLYAKGDCWHGGGLFLDEKEFWLNDGRGHEQLMDSSEIKRNESYKPSKQYGGECLHVYYNRLQRDGWVLKSMNEKGKWHSETVFEKSLPKKWVLVKICHQQVFQPKGKGCYWDEHELRNEDNETFSRSNWEWADLVDDSIVYADTGCLYKITIMSSMKLSEPILLHDFNEYKFENIQAPY